MYGKGGRFGYGSRAPGRLVARPDTLPGSYAPGQGPATAPDPAPGNPQQPNPARQQLRTALFDFVKGVYDQPGDAKVSDYLGSFADGAWAAPTGMSADLAGQINGMLGNKPRFGEKAQGYLGQYGAQAVPDSILSRLMQRPNGQIPMGLYGMGMAGMYRGHFNGHPVGQMPNQNHGRRRRRRGNRRDDD